MQRKNPRTGASSQGASGEKGPASRGTAAAWWERLIGRGARGAAASSELRASAGGEAKQGDIAMSTTEQAAAHQPKPDSAEEAHGPRDSNRDTLESVVIAFVLAFLFRTFAAEAFVIPTGSMAPTLMGRHKAYTCAQCGTSYQVNEREMPEGWARAEEGQGGICPNCQFPNVARREGEPAAHPAPAAVWGAAGPYLGEAVGKHPPLKGDRILVAKVPYLCSEPRRWDVAVFKYPLGAKTAFIKRLVGLPNETLVLQGGDVLTMAPGTLAEFRRKLARLPGHGPLAADLETQPLELVEVETLRREGKLQIQRKPPDKVVAMLQPVYDNDHLVPLAHRRGLPYRWQVQQPEGPNRWQPEDEQRSFHVRAANDTWLTYQHYLPTPGLWKTLLARRLTPEERRHLRPRLITDQYAYNCSLRWRSVGSLQENAGGWLWSTVNRDWCGLHWVGDLAVECDLLVESDRGTLTLELVEGGVIFSCKLDVASGHAALACSALPAFRPAGKTPLQGPGRYRLRFANVDDQLHLWVNDDLVEFNEATSYSYLANHVPTERDLIPVRIGASGGLDARASSLRILRDIYYVPTFEPNSFQAASFRKWPSGEAISAYTEAPANANADGSTDAAAFHRQWFTAHDAPLETLAERAQASAQSLHDALPHWSRELDEVSYTVATAMSDPEYFDHAASLRIVHFHVPNDCYFMLGDNSPRSSDSRLWAAGRLHEPQPFVPRDLLIGKAMYVFWPHAWVPDWGMRLQLGWLELNLPFLPNFKHMRFIH
jgi:signal peptidase I